MSAALSATTTAGLRILALTLWGEGEGRAVRGLEGIAAVVMTRDRLAALPGGPVHFGRGIAAICRQPFQFPCWNPRGARLGEMREALARPDAQFAICLRIAGRALAGALPDPTGGATRR